MKDKLWPQRCVCIYMCINFLFKNRRLKRIMELVLLPWVDCHCYMINFLCQVRLLLCFDLELRHFKQFLPIFLFSFSAKLEPQTPFRNNIISVFLILYPSFKSLQSFPHFLLCLSAIFNFNSSLKFSCHYCLTFHWGSVSLKVILLSHV